MVGRIRFALECFGSPCHGSHVAQLLSLTTRAMNLFKRPRLVSKAICWIAILVTGLFSWKFGDHFTIRITSIAPSYFYYWSLTLLLGQLLTAMICFLLLYRGVVFGLVARLALKQGITLQAESVFVGMLLSAFLPLLIWAVGDALMFDFARSGMHDSM